LIMFLLLHDALLPILFQPLHFTYCTTFSVHVRGLQGRGRIELKKGMLEKHDVLQ
jgi:hypothetical protein